LGFDTYLVMRHGMRSKGIPKEDRLGCYFCNDVVAPTDSLTDRTLDQQCTVTRPGLSGIASATVVELLASILQHPKGPWAESEIVSDSDKSPSTPLGIVPHQIRGFLAKFTNLILTGSGYDKCIACSDDILDAYRTQGHEFIKNVIKTPALLEDLTGLKRMKDESDKVDLDWDQGEEDF
jgi:ubiquitin-like modifier-activating enzyme ATG7